MTSIRRCFFLFSLACIFGVTQAFGASTSKTPPPPKALIMTMVKDIDKIPEDMTFLMYCTGKKTNVTTTGRVPNATTGSYYIIMAPPPYDENYTCTVGKMSGGEKSSTVPRNVSPAIYAKIKFICEYQPASKSVKCTVEN